jgi:hypothetical protein
MGESRPNKKAGTRPAGRDELLRVREQLEAMIANLDAELLKGNGGSSSAPSGRQGRTTRSVTRPVRALVLDVLDDLDWPAYSREVSHYSAARFGREIPPARFGTLGIDEMRSFQSGTQRPVWLCFALTHDRHQAIKRLWARSDWSLERRIVAPTTGRVQHLRITRQLCELALRADESAADPDMLRIIAADHARDLPGMRVQRGRFELEMWRDAAARSLAELEPRDAELRAESARRLAARPEAVQMFGMLDVIDGAEMSRHTNRG